MISVPTFPFRWAAHLVVIALPQLNAPVSAAAGVTVNDGIVSLEWEAPAGDDKLFLVQSKDNLEESPWVSAGLTSEPRFSLPRFNDSRFFRVVTDPFSTSVPLSVILSGEHQKPEPIVTTASGSGLAILEGNKLTFSIALRGLRSRFVGAHIHGPASTSGIAEPVLELKPLPLDDGHWAVSGVLDIDHGQRDAIMEGDCYINIARSAHPSGEIRGQNAPVTMGMSMSSGESGSSRSDSGASGRGQFLLIHDKLYYKIHYRNLSSEVQTNLSALPFASRIKKRLPRTLLFLDGRRATTGWISGKDTCSGMTGTAPSPASPDRYLSKSVIP